MASRSPGKNNTRGPSKAGGKKKAGTRSEAGTRPKKKKESASRGAGRTKAASKTTKPGTKKKTRQKKESFLARHQSYILGLSLGLVIGCLAAVLIIYAPEVIKKPQKAEAGRTKKNGGPTAKSSEKTAQAGQVKSPSKKIQYEEHHPLESLLKRLDQEIYTTLHDIKVPDEDVHFIRITPQRLNDRYWDHVLIEVSPPAKISVREIEARLKKRMKQSRLEPKPEISSVHGEGFVTAEIEYDGLKTHTVRLLAPQRTASIPPQTKRPAKPSPVPSGSRPKVAIVIDDFGLNLAEARCFLNTKIPLTFSVLPFLQRSSEVARLIHKKGRPVMLHMPMQPVQWPNVDAGPGVLLVSMGEREIKSKIRAALDDVPYVVGVNNHMGSRFTEDRVRMGWALEALKERNLPFVDSMTSTRSVALAEARRLGVVSARRTIFLDNVQSPQAIRFQLKKLITQARQQGWAIGIGHVYPVTCQVLKNEYNYLRSRADLVFITSLL